MSNNKIKIPKNLTSWDKDYPKYNPPYHTDKNVLDNIGIWADIEDIKKINFKNRSSFEGNLIFDNDGYPLNPKGRAGIKGRGLLGKWGPNFAADPIITRNHPENNKLELLVIKRSDTGDWAIPGGMVDKKEDAMTTALRELIEEALIENSNFNMHGAKLIYSGYVHDPRNTDNAWIESSAFHKHLKNSENLKLKAGDDATDVKWLELTEKNINSLYANHPKLVKLVLKYIQ